MPRRHRYSDADKSTRLALKFRKLPLQTLETEEEHMHEENMNIAFAVTLAFAVAAGDGNIYNTGHINRDRQKADVIKIITSQCLIQLKSHTQTFSHGPTRSESTTTNRLKMSQHSH